VSGSPRLRLCAFELTLLRDRLLMTKMQDEVKALQLCQSKVRQKKLPMEVVDAEYQW
jgi:cell fate regulator YaaT (PSP1 superfamily)